MPWIEPVTNRVAGSRTTATDMNRICGNILYKGGSLPKSSYISSDIVEAATWNKIVRYAKTSDPSVDYSTLYSNLNKIEAAIENIDMKFVTANRNRGLGVCTDGEEWEYLNFGYDTDDIDKLAFGKGKFVGTGYNGWTYHSQNGTDWTRGSGLDSDDNYLSLCYGNDVFVCGGSSKIYRSEDGASWNLAETMSCGPMVFTGSEFVMAYVSSTYAEVFKSSDGRDWVRIGTTPTAGSHVASIAYGNGRLVFVGEDGLAKCSTNGGASWTAMSGLRADIYYNSVAFGNGKFVCVGDGGSTAYSTNGTSWTSGTGLDTSKDYNDIVYGKDRFVCVGDGRAAYSLDGTSWVNMSGVGISRNYPCITTNFL